MFFIHQAVERLDLKQFEEGYSEEGHPGYHPALQLKVWLYAYALGGDEFTAVAAADPGGFGVSVFGRGSAAGLRCAGTLTRSGMASGAAVHETQAAFTGRTRGLSAKKSDRGAGAGSTEGAARNATIPIARVGESGGGVHFGRDGVEPHAIVARQAAVALHRLSNQRGLATVVHITLYEKLAITATNQ